ncbi:MAG: DeoR/GlpR family DNA-binding transcription regulator, partial [Fimbriimonadaceae bacterium]|nr:DeoR/GlpR family DNA-binding transcription regulator [Fimbriimonadaceae bacterium]
MVQSDPGPELRREAILRLVREGRSLRVADLAGELGVHEMTIRRDLDRLADEGLVERFHGGARPGQRAGEELSHQVRRAQAVEAKRRLAERALEWIEDGETIGLDASTTCLELARRLAGRRVTVVTTGLETAQVLAESGVGFILAGGEFHAPARAFVGGLVLQSLDALSLDRVFVSCKGYVPDEGLYDPYLPEVEVKAKMIDRSAWSAALIDSEKLHRRALSRICRP